MLRHAIPDIELRTRLQERGLECHLLIKGEDQSRHDFAEGLRDELGSLLTAAYDRVPQAAHFRYEDWAVTIRSQRAAGPPVACATLCFYSDFPSYFKTHFEAVHPDHQRQGLGRLLYDCLAVWTRFLVFNDVLAREGVVQCGGAYCLVSCVDVDDEGDWETSRDNKHGHGAFLHKLGFIRAQHDFGQSEEEIAFQREFHVPLLDEDGEA